MNLKQTTKNNLKVLSLLPKYMFKFGWERSKNPWRVFSKALSFKNTAQLAKAIATLNIDKIKDEVVNALNVDELINAGISQDIKDAKFFIRNAKDALNELSEIRKENIEMDKQNKDKKKVDYKNSYKDRTARNNNLKKGSSDIRSNHGEWYTKDPLSTRGLVGINVSTRTNAVTSRMADTLVNVDETASTKSVNIVDNIGIPSVCSINLNLVIPKSDTNDWQQAINLLYKNVRSANAGSINFSPGQLANYVLYVRALDASLTSLNRAIKVLNYIEFYDAKSPQSLFAGMGLDYDTFVANSANARELYNRLAAIRYRMAPLNISLLDRTRWLFSNIFTDSNDAKAQSYIFTANSMKVYLNPADAKEPYVEKDYSFGSTTLSNTATGMTYEQFSKSIIALYQGFQDDSVYQIIAGDILKAYGKESLTKLPELGAFDKIEPYYDEWILTQIQNISLPVDTPIVTSNLTQDFVTQDIKETLLVTANNGITDYLSTFNDKLSNPEFNANVNIIPEDRLLSLTRFMTSRTANDPTASGADDGFIHYDVYGTEIVSSMVITYAKSNSRNAYNFAHVTMGWLTPLAIVGSDGGRSITASPAVMAWSWFDYFPQIIPTITSWQTQFGETAKNYVIDLLYDIFDYNTFGIAYKDNLNSYHAIATLSMLYKPFVSRVNKTEVFD